MARLVSLLVATLIALKFVLSHQVAAQELDTSNIEEVNNDRFLNTGNSGSSSSSPAVRVSSPPRSLRSPPRTPRVPRSPPRPPSNPRPPRPPRGPRSPRLPPAPLLPPPSPSAPPPPPPPPSPSPPLPPPPPPPSPPPPPPPSPASPPPPRSSPPPSPAPPPPPHSSPPPPVEDENMEDAREDPPPPPQTPPSGNVIASLQNPFIPCRLNRNDNVIVDGEQFPFGVFNNDTCSCNSSPFEFRVGSEIFYRGREYYTFRLYAKACNTSVTANNRNVCETIGGFINKIALRLEARTAPCFTQRGTLPDIDHGESARNIFFWPDSAREATTLSARVGMSKDKEQVELYLYSIKGGGATYTNGRFMIPKCHEVGAFSNYCKGSVDGKCLFSFVDTPRHDFVAICRATGIS